MLCRSRFYFAFLVSSLALMVSLGAATEVVSNSSSRYRVPRSHRIIREFDVHGFEVLPEISHDRNTGSRLTVAGPSKDSVVKPVPISIVQEITDFRVGFVLGEVPPGPRNAHSFRPTSIPLSRGPPLA
jgi:hypothetical protein